MFKQFNNIETAFKRMRLFMIILIIGCLSFAGYLAYASFAFIDKNSSRIYVLADGQALILARSSNIKENRPAEAKDHIKRFHELFFSLDPDEKVINERMKEALYYGDNSVQSQYQNLKEKGYFNKIVGANISQELIIDSIHINDNNIPYFAEFFGKEKIIRTSTITYRLLVTQCYLRNVTRTDNNPHGFLMENWTIRQNNDLKIIDRNTGSLIVTPAPLIDSLSIK